MTYLFMYYLKMKTLVIIIIAIFLSSCAPSKKLWNDFRSYDDGRTREERFMDRMEYYARQKQYKEFQEEVRK